MTHEQKRQIKDALVRYTRNFETQTAAAESLEGISASTISQVKNLNWDLLSDRLWRNIARQVGFYCSDWTAADTSVHLLLRILFGDAQRFSSSYGVAISSGLGKTFTATHYARENENVIYIAGDASYNRRSFATALLKVVDEVPGDSTPYMLQQLTDIIAQKENAVVVIDDAHLLKDRVLHLVVMIADNISEKAGIILMGNETLRTRIIEGLRLKKPGFEEIYNMIGKRFITLTCLSLEDIAAVCRTNGIHDDALIEHIQISSDNNLHTTTCLIGQHQQQNIAA